MAEDQNETQDPIENPENASFEDKLVGLGIPSEISETIGQTISDMNIEQLAVLREEVNQRYVEQSAEVEAKNKIPNPIPDLTDALKRGSKVAGDGYNGIEELPRWAQRLGRKIDTAKIVSDNPDVEIVNDLVTRGDIPSSVTLEELQDRYDGRLMVQDVVHHLKELGVVPDDSPDTFTYNEENGYLISLFKKGGGVDENTLPPESDGGSGITEFTKNSRFPGVTVTLAVRSDMLKSYSRFGNGNGYPIIKNIRLNFSPEALVSMAPSNQVTKEKPTTATPASSQT